MKRLSFTAQADMHTALVRLRRRLRSAGIVASLAAVVRLVLALGIPAALAEVSALQPPPPPPRRRRARRLSAASAAPEAPAQPSGGTGAPEARQATLVAEVDFVRHGGVVRVRRAA